MIDSLRNREILIEMVVVANIMRVTAMDTASLTEIIISGPVTTPKNILKQNALKRMEYVLRKKGLIA